MPNQIKELDVEKWSVSFPWLGRHKFPMAAASKSINHTTYVTIRYNELEITRTITDYSLYRNSTRPSVVACRDSQRHDGRL